MTSVSFVGLRGVHCVAILASSHERTRLLPAWGRKHNEPARNSDWKSSQNLLMIPGKRDVTFKTISAQVILAQEENKSLRVRPRARQLHPHSEERGQRDREGRAGQRLSAAALGHAIRPAPPL